MMSGVCVMKHPCAMVDVGVSRWDGGRDGGSCHSYGDGCGWLLHTHAEAVDCFSCKFRIVKGWLDG